MIVNRTLNRVISSSPAIQDTLLDLTGDSVAPANLALNETAHDKEGEGITGSFLTEDAEAWAVGTRNGIPVEPSDVTYHNNSYWYAKVSETEAVVSGSCMRIAGEYADAAEESSIISGSAMRIAGEYRDEAYNSAVISGSAMRIAGQNAENAEAWAVGKRDGEDVPSTDPTYHNNSAYWAEYARQYAAGGIHYKSRIYYADIPTSGLTIGDMYDIKDDFITDSRFEDGAGIECKAGTNIIWNVNNKWDLDIQGGGGGHTILDEDGTTYPQRSKLQFEGCEVTDDAVNGITVVKCEGGGVKKYAKPVITVGTYTYDGTTQAPTITGFDADVMTLTGTYEAINAGSYTFTIALSDKTSSKWTDDTQDDIVTNWSIDAISVAVPTVTNTTKTYNGSAQSPTITRDTANTSISGTTSATKVKSNYSFSIALTDTTNHKWSDNTTATKSYTWKINPPTGSSYTPVNDIQAWLACASIDKTYTTIAQVLADATTLSALMLSNNAVDYLVRSTSWVSNITGNQTAMTYIGASNYCADTLLANSTWRTAICNSTYFESVLNVKVPAMTSNTTPSGVTSIKSPNNIGNDAWCGFANSDSKCAIASGNDSSTWIQYKFNTPVVCYKLHFEEHGNSYEVTPATMWSSGKIQGSNDGVNFTDLLTITGQTVSLGKKYDYIFANNIKYMYYRIQVTALGTDTGYTEFGKKINFYGRS